jgi:hypothetical protein
MTDTYRALCEELEDAYTWCIEEYMTAPAEEDTLIQRARAALAQPEPVAPPMPMPGDAEGLAEVFWNRYEQPEPEGPTDEELYELWEREGYEGDFQDCRRFYRGAIARWGRPTPQPPADGEVAELVAWLLREADYQEITVKRATCADRIRRAACLLEHPTPQPPAELAEMVKRLHEINSPTPQPVAVSERPWERDGWCDEQGRCWWTASKPGPLPPVWWMVSIPQSCTDGIMLPANALPIPEALND